MVPAVWGQFCVALGMSFNVDTARRLCQQAGLEYPAPHWGAQPGVMPGETAAQRIERENREDKLARKVHAGRRALQAREGRTAGPTRVPRRRPRCRRLTRAAAGLQAT